MKVHIDPRFLFPQQQVPPYQTPYNPYFQQQPPMLPVAPVMDPKAYRKLRKQVLRDLAKEEADKKSKEKPKEPEKKKWPFSVIETAMLIMMAAIVVNSLIDIMSKVKTPF